MWRLLAALLLLGAWADPAPAEERVIVAFGDSLTAGLGVPREPAYPALLAARLAAGGTAYRVVNAGVSGDTTAGGLRRVEWALRFKPEIVILELGINDGMRGQEPTSVEVNLDRIGEGVKRAGGRGL